MAGSPYYYPVAAQPLIDGAANIPCATNPAFTSVDFLAFYPQFTNTIASAVLNQFITMANATVLEARWHEAWKLGMCLFVAHFATLYLQALVGTNATAGQVVAAAQTRGLLTSKSVDSVSASYDLSHLAADLNGWAAWKSTTFGTQYATMAKLLGKGGMYIY